MRDRFFSHVCFSFLPFLSLALFLLKVQKSRPVINVSLQSLEASQPAANQAPDMSPFGNAPCLACNLLLSAEAVLNFDQLRPGSSFQIGQRGIPYLSFFKIESNYNILLFRSDSAEIVVSTVLFHFKAIKVQKWPHTSGTGSVLVKKGEQN